MHILEAMGGDAIKNTRATLRLVCWLAAVIFALAPTFFGVAGTPHQIGKLFQIESYLTLSRDLIYLSISVLAIGLIDSFEGLIQIQSRRSRIGQIIFALTFVFMILLIFQLVIYSFWSARTEMHFDKESISSIFYLPIAAASNALIARILLIVAPLG
jgi:uncharacterized membrane protein